MWRYICLSVISLVVIHHVGCVKYVVLEDEGLEPYIELPLEELMRSENLILIPKDKPKQPTPKTTPAPVQEKPSPDKKEAAKVAAPAPKARENKPKPAAPKVQPKAKEPAKPAQKAIADKQPPPAPQQQKAPPPPQKQQEEHKVVHPPLQEKVADNKAVPVAVKPEVAHPDLKPGQRMPIRPAPGDTNMELPKKRPNVINMEEQGQKIWRQDLRLKK